MIKETDPCPGTKDGKHRFPRKGNPCRCHQYCTACTAQRETKKAAK